MKRFHVLVRQTIRELRDQGERFPDLRTRRWPCRGTRGRIRGALVVGGILLVSTPPDLQITFVKNERGEITHLVLHQGGQDHLARRIR